MASIKLSYDSADDIPEGYADLYTEKDGKHELTGVTGMKSVADFSRLNTSLTKEREMATGLKAKLNLFKTDTVGADSSIEDWTEHHSGIVTELDTIPELKAAAKGLNDEEMEAVVQRRSDAKIRGLMAPMERENKTLKADNAEKGDRIGGYEKADVSRTVRASIRKALKKAKVIDDAIDDALDISERLFEIREDDSAVVTRDSVGVTPGLDAAGWIEEIADSKRYWFGETVGGGSGGSRGGGGPSGSNPWHESSWNATKQGQFIKEHGIEKAHAKAAAAKSKVGATGPTVKART